MTVSGDVCNDNEIPRKAEMHRVPDNDIPSDSNLAGPMTRLRLLRLKREREGPEPEEVISGSKGNECNNNNHNNKKNQKRIDVTQLDAFAIASSMLNCSYGDAETQLSESEEDDRSLQKQPEPMPMASPMTEATFCHGNGSRDDNNTSERDIEGGKMSAFMVASEMLDCSFADLGEMETEVSRVDSDYHATPPTPPPPPHPPVIKKKRKFHLGSYRGKAKSAWSKPIAGHSNERAPHSAATGLKHQREASAFEYLHVDLERDSELFLFYSF